MATEDVRQWARDELAVRGGMAVRISVEQGVQGPEQRPRATYSFDESGALVAHEIDYPPSYGIARVVQRFDRQGEQIHLPCVRREVRDSADGGMIVVEDFRDCAAEPREATRSGQAGFRVGSPVILESHRSVAGHLVRRTWYDAGRIWQSETEYVRDDQGRIVEETHRTPLKVPPGAARKAILRYLNLKEPAVVVDRTVYAYDEAGRLIERTTEKVGVSVTVATFRYDGRGDLAEVEERSSGGAPPQRYGYTYEYNARGDWTLRTQRSEGQVVNVTRREIVYRN